MNEFNSLAKAIEALRASSRDFGIRSDFLWMKVILMTSQYHLVKYIGGLILHNWMFKEEI